MGDENAPTGWEAAVAEIEAEFTPDEILPKSTNTSPTKEQHPDAIEQSRANQAAKPKAVPEPKARAASKPDPEGWTGSDAIVDRKPRSVGSKDSFRSPLSPKKNDDDPDVYVRADGKRVRRVRRTGAPAGPPPSGVVSSDDEGQQSGTEIYVRPDGKKVRRVKVKRRKKKQSSQESLAQEVDGDFMGDDDDDEPREKSELLDGETPKPKDPPPSPDRHGMEDEEYEEETEEVAAWSSNEAQDEPELADDSEEQEEVMEPTQMENQATKKEVAPKPDPALLEATERAVEALTDPIEAQRDDAFLPETSPPNDVKTLDELKAERQRQSKSDRLARRERLSAALARDAIEDKASVPTQPVPITVAAIAGAAKSALKASSEEEAIRDSVAAIAGAAKTALQVTETEDESKRTKEEESKEASTTTIQTDTKTPADFPRSINVPSSNLDNTASTEVATGSTPRPTASRSPMRGHAARNDEHASRLRDDPISRSREDLVSRSRDDAVTQLRDAHKSGSGEGGLWQAASEDDAPPDPKRKSRLPEQIAERTRSRADVEAPAAEDGNASPHVFRLEEDEDAFIFNANIARKRVRVVQLLMFGLVGLGVGFLGSFYVQSTCYFGSAQVNVGSNEQPFDLHFGLWKYSPIESAFDGYSFCSEYDDKYNDDAPQLARIFGALAFLAGAYSLAVLWFYLIFGIATQNTWVWAVRVCILAGILQGMTLSFFRGEVCERNTCAVGPGAFVSVLSSITWFVLGFEMNYNMPMSAMIQGLSNRHVGTNLMATLEMSDFSHGAKAYIGRMDDDGKEYLPTLNQMRRAKEGGSVVNDGASNTNATSAGSYRPPIF